MRVDGMNHCFHRRLGFHRGHRFGDQLESLRPNDVDAEDLPIGLIADDFDEAFMHADDCRLAVSDKRELAHLHFEALFFRLLLRQADTAYPRLGVRRTWNSILIDGNSLTAGHVIEGDHTFHGRDVCELRRTSNDIADRINTRLASLLKLIHLNEAPIQLDFGALETALVRVRPTAYRNQQF